MKPIILILLTVLLLLGCQSKLKDSTKKKLHLVETKKMSFQDFKTVELDPCDTFSIEVEGIYPVIDELAPAHLDTAFLDNELKQKGFKTYKSGWGNFEEGPRLLSIELSKQKCNCKVYKKYILKERIGDDGLTRNFYIVTEKIVCNASNNGVE